jgi:hypothetical protein
MGSRLWSSALATFACVTAIGVGAQSPGASPQSGANRTTVTGCLELTEQSVVGTSGSLGTLVTAAPDTTFVLTRATVPTTNGVAAPAATTLAQSTYRIDIVDEGKLWLHVGHILEIAGTLSSATPGMYPKLLVQSVKLISASCEG